MEPGPRPQVASLPSEPVDLDSPAAHLSGNLCPAGALSGPHEVGKGNIMRRKRFFAPLLVVTAALAVPAVAQERQEVSLKQPVTLSFRDTPLQFVLEAIRDKVHVNIVCDPAIDVWRVPVTVQVSDGPVSELLDSIEEQIGAKRKIWCGVVYLAPKGKVPGAEPAAPEGEGAQALLQRINVRFERDPFAKVVANLRSQVPDVEFELPARVRIQLRRTAGVTLRAWGLPVHRVLDLMARAQGLSWKLEGGKVVFAVEAAERQVDIDPLELPGEGVDPDAIDIDREVARLARRDTRSAAVRMLTRAGKDALPKVAALLGRADPATCEAALKVIESIGDPSEYTAVLRLFRDTRRSLELRSNAGLVLATIKAPESVPYLVEALDDPWFRISETARRALVAIGPPAVPRLEQRYVQEVNKSKAKDGIIYRSLLILGEIDSDDARSRLVRALATTTGPRALAVRHHAAIGIGFTGNPEMIAPMIRALERESDFLVAKYIARSLSWITNEDLPPEGRAWRAWWELEGEEKFFPSKADDLLEELGGVIELPVDPATGLPILESDDTRLSRLIKELRSPDTAKSQAAAASLRAMGEQALPALRKLAEDDKLGPRARELIAEIEAR